LLWGKYKTERKRKRVTGGMGGWSFFPRTDIEVGKKGGEKKKKKKRRVWEKRGDDLFVQELCMV